MSELLTIDELSELLKMSRRQVYELTRVRTREKMTIPLPLIRINGNTRFLRSEVEKWLKKLAEVNE
jgi:excisionase family DNA binding protein